MTGTQNTETGQRRIHADDDAALLEVSKADRYFVESSMPVLKGHRLALSSASLSDRTRWETADTEVSHSSMEHQDEPSSTAGQGL